MPCCFIFQEGRRQKTVTARQHKAHKTTKKQGRPKGGIEKTGPEIITGQPASRSKHEVNNAVDQKQTHPGRTKIDPANGLVGPVIHPAKGVEVDKQGHDLHQEEDPFSSPTKHKGMD